MNPQVWNLYAYARNNPLSLVDRDGSRNSEFLLPYENRGVKVHVGESEHLNDIAITIADER